MPAVRPRLLEIEQRALRRRRAGAVIADKTWKRVGRLVAQGVSGVEISRRLKISLPQAAAMRRSILLDLGKKPGIKLRASD